MSTLQDMLNTTIRIKGLAKEFTHRELTLAFEKVQDPHDWRAPIDCWIDKNDVALYEAAIIYFTGTTPLIFVPSGNTKTWRIKSVGYRNGPCGP